MPRILVVDDERVMVKGIKFNLENEGYQVDTGSDGEEAVDKARMGQYDLIILDLMMPKIDGLQACMKIREFSNVPVIMLTAKGEDTDKIIGFECGADDYITKPFNMEVLKLRINKIIEMNVKRQKIFNQDIKIEPSRITITPLDRQLVEKAIRIVEDNISETEFSVEELASSLNISRSYFYKKMIKITGKKPIEFIRTIRMKRAQQLLTESQMQIAEIAYTLGYNSPKVFSKHFKDEFHISPSEFIKQQAEYSRYFAPIHPTLLKQHSG